MSYHNIPNAAQQSKTNAQGKTAPPGHHYMPDGTLMSDVDHEAYSSAKIIKSFVLDTSNIAANGEVRQFTINGDNGAIFSLEIKNEDNYYYNFVTNKFQAVKTKLNNEVIYGKKFIKNVTFPLVTDADQYDFLLFTGEGTEHNTYNEVRFEDNSLDINSSTGSNSNLIKKVIYQTLDVTLVLSTLSPNSVTVFAGHTPTTRSIVIPINKNTGKKAFSIPVSAGSTHSFKIKKTPTIEDVGIWVTRTVGSAPDNISGEDIYPAVSDTDTVNGAVTSGITVTMDGAVASNVVVGDRVTGNTALNAKVVTVVALTGTYTFTLSEAIAIADGITLSFSNRMNYRWPLDNIDGLRIGMLPVTNNITSGSVISSYEDILTVMGGTKEEQKITQVRVEALDKLGVKPTITRNATTKLLTTVQTGNIIFSKQQKLVLAGDALKFYSYGSSAIKALSGWEIELSDITVTLTKPTAVTTSAVSASTSVPIDDGDGIMDDVSTVSGIGIDPSVVDPTVTTIGSYSGTTATLTLSAAQTLEDGATLTFDGAGRTITIAGNIEIKKSEQIRADWNGYLYFDLEKFITATDES